MSRGVTRRELRIGEIEDPLPAALASGTSLTATWTFPDAPLVPITLDGLPLAFVDYSPASGSAHWYLRWDDPGVAPHAAVALDTLAGQVPEDVDTDEQLRVAVLDAALMAAISTLHVAPGHARIRSVHST